MKRNEFNKKTNYYSTRIKKLRKYQVKYLTLICGIIDFNY